MQPESNSRRPSIDVTGESPLTCICARAATASQSIHDGMAAEYASAKRRERRHGKNSPQSESLPMLGAFSGSWTGSSTGGVDVSNRLETVDTLIRQLNKAQSNEHTDSGRVWRESYRSINQASRLSPVQDGARDTSPVLRLSGSEKQAAVVNFDPPSPLKAEVCAAPSTTPNGLPIVYAEIRSLPSTRPSKPEKQAVAVNFDPPRPQKAAVCAAPLTSQNGLPIVFAEIRPLPSTGALPRRSRSNKPAAVANSDSPRPLKEKRCAAPLTNRSGLPIVVAEIHPLPLAPSPPPIRRKQPEDQLSGTYQSGGPCGR